MFQSAEPTPILSAVIALVFLSKSCVWKRAGAVIIKYNRQFYDIWRCTTAGKINLTNVNGAETGASRCLGASKHKRRNIGHIDMCGINEWHGK